MIFLLSSSFVYDGVSGVIISSVLSPLSGIVISSPLDGSSLDGSSPLPGVTGSLLLSGVGVTPFLLTTYSPPFVNSAVI